MRYAQIRDMDISNGEGIGVSLFTQGCPFHCEGCHNSETWSFTDGKEFTSQEYDKIIQLMNKNYISRFSLLGGEPLLPANLETICSLLEEIRNKYPSKKIWIWTGFTMTALQSRITKEPMLQRIFDCTDILITGPFILQQKDLTLKWKGSANQEVWDMTTQPIHVIG